MQLADPEAIDLSRTGSAVLLYVSSVIQRAELVDLHDQPDARSDDESQMYRRWRLSYYWILPLLASLARVEIAVTVMVVGLLLLGVSRSHARVVIAIGSTVGLALVAFMVLAPDQGSSVGAHFDYLGIESLSQLPRAIVSQPGAVLGQIFDPVFVTSVLMWLVTIGVVLPLRAPRWFLVGVPMLLLAAIGVRSTRMWYQSY